MNICTIERNFSPKSILPGKNLHSTPKSINSKPLLKGDVEKVHQERKIS